MIDSVKMFWKDVVRKPPFFVSFAVMAILGYIPSLSVSRLHFEDVLRDHYTGNHGVMWSGRWGFILWEKLVTFHIPNDVLEKSIAFLFFIVAALGIGALIYRIDSKSASLSKYLIVCTGIITFPLVAEIWNYNTANFVTCGNLLIVVFTILFFMEVQMAYWKKILMSILPLALVASSYEVAIFSYVLLVLLLLLYQSINGERTVPLIKKGMLLATPLFCGVLVSWGIGHIICAIRGITYFRNGETQIAWLQDNFSIRLFVKTLIEKYFLRALVYFPIGVFVLCSVFYVGIVLAYFIRKKNGAILLFGLFAYLSVFLQAFIQGKPMPYRTAQSLSIFVGFVLFLLLDLVQDKKLLFGVIFMFALFLCYRQSAFLNQLNLFSVRMAQVEEQTVRMLGDKLYYQYDQKPVLIVVLNTEGEEEREELLLQMICPEDNWKSRLYQRKYLEWFQEDVTGKTYTETVYKPLLRTFLTDREALETLFSYLGYPITVLDNGNLPVDYVETEILIDYGELSRNDIRDMGDYVVVVF